MILKETNPKARKEYECEACKHKIAKNTKYHKLNILDEDNGNVFTVKYCEDCYIVFQKMSPECRDCAYLHCTSALKLPLQCDEDDCSDW